MSSLTHEQWKRLNQFFLELHAEHTREHFFRCCLEELPKVLGVTWAAWNEMDEDYQFVDFKVSNTYAEDVPKFAAVMEDTIGTHPIVEGLKLQHRPGPMTGVHMVSDFVSDRQKRERAIFRDAYRFVDIHHQMYAEMHFTPKVRSSVTINSTGPIREEQRLMAAIAAEHMVLAFRNILKLEAPPLFFREHDRRRELMEPLSPRLRETLGHLLNGLPRKLIAHEMKISLHTLNDYVREVYARLNVHSHAELVCLFHAPPP